MKCPAIFLTSVSLSVCQMAGAGVLSTGAGQEYFSFGAVPSLSSPDPSSDAFNLTLNGSLPLRYGNWFPALPDVSLSYSKGNLYSGISSEETEATGVHIALPVKRIGNWFLYLYAGEHKWKQVLTVEEPLLYVRETAFPLALNEDQSVRMTHQRRYVGSGFRTSPRRSRFLNEFKLRIYNIDQPLQADVSAQPLEGLFRSDILFYELSVGKYANEKGLNLNWELGIGAGEATLGSDIRIVDEEEADNLITAHATFEIIYSMRLSRRWSGFVSGKVSALQWQQENESDFAELNDGQYLYGAFYSGFSFRF